MDILLGALITGILLMSVTGILVYRAQKKLDAPYGGILVVEKIEGEPTGIYFQAFADPGAFTDGQELKLKVKVVTSQL